VHVVNVKCPADGRVLHLQPRGPESDIGQMGFPAQEDGSSNNNLEHNMMPL
jgi:hypothetical protein